MKLDKDKHDHNGDAEQEGSPSRQFQYAELASSDFSLQGQLVKLYEVVDKLENDKVASLTREVEYLRGLVAMQNVKIDKLTGMFTAYFESKNEESLISSIQAIEQQAEDRELQQQLESNMDPALHQVAVAAAAVQAQSNDRRLGQNFHDHHDVHPDVELAAAAAAAAVHAQQEDDAHGKKKSYISKRKASGQSVDIDAGDGDELHGGEYDKNKKPKIVVDFLHNPMSIKEIYDEFTKGFRGQLPLKEMDAKYGKHEWRGDSRSKESKRFQRRKRLYDAIERGVLKYGKTPDEIISYIERYRGDKLLTWVMNGNLPLDLTS